MPRNAVVAAGLAAGLLIVPVSQAFGQSWVNFVNETSTRLVADSGLVLTDPQEKDYGYGDFDNDGDEDLVIVRKTPFSVAGRHRNVLLMNEGIAQGHAINGVLVDRTTEYGTAATDGGQGLKDLTDDRDVVVVDVNSDGWLDFVTATTFGGALPKTISHPRVYMNLAEVGGVWQGFRYEENRFPNFGSHPNFCGVGAGDVNGDKAPDLYFVDYDRAPNSVFDDRLVMNNGAGFFTDQTAARVNTAMSESNFGTTANIVDMNGDNKLDIVKSENGPVKISYNNGTGNFPAPQATYGGAAYHASVGELNGDGRMDIIISDDATDKYLLNQNGSGGGQSTFTNLNVPNSGGFGSVSRSVDINNDGWRDVLICDVDVDASGCSRFTKIFRNLGNAPNVTLSDQGLGGIPTNMLQGCYDVAIMDLNSDGWKDLVVGRCTSTQIWMQVPPSGLVFTYPQGIPGFVPSDTAHNFQVQVSAVGGGSPVPGSGVLHYSVNGGPYSNVPMNVISGNLYGTQLPAAACTNIISFYITAQITGGGTFSDPATGATNPYKAVAADGSEITFTERMEGDVSAWTVQNHASLTQGAWAQADPNGTVNFQALASPEDDAGANDDVKCFTTENGPPGGAANANDVDGGPTTLVSPVIDLAGTDATISYQRWFYSLPADDFLRTEVSNNNGSSWVLVHQTGGTGSAWEEANFRVGQFVTPTAQVRVRFIAHDIATGSVTEAGIDNFIVEEVVCGGFCQSDITGNGTVDIDDLLAVINAWGALGGPADVNSSGAVDIDDLLTVINAWGACD